MPDPEPASEFLETLNKSHPSIDFKMELTWNDLEEVEALWLFSASFYFKIDS